MSRFFIDRPIFAWVIAIVIMLAGGLAILRLPIAQYPTIAPPAIAITANYPGASAKIVENSVTQVIEQNMTGVDNLLYMSSTSDSTGSVTITVTFNAGTDADIAQVQVQNKLQLATPLLPQEVQNQGVTVTKSAASFVLVVGFISEDGSMSSIDLGDYVTANLKDPISRIEGVGDITVFGAQYAMRIWLDPNRLDNFALTPIDVVNAIKAQNIQVSAGQLGGVPSIAGQRLNATVTAQTRFQTADQFRQILLKTSTDGSNVRLQDVARVELGAETYDTSSRYNGKPSTAIAIKLATGANALDTAKMVKERIGELAPNFPIGMRVVYPFDTTPFVRLSIEEVVKTLLEAIVLVFMVMYLFLQNFRATLIPTIAVPVVLLGTFGVLEAVGYSINTLTMFAMVLAIGLLVDDAIVVVENVERVMAETKLSPVEATRKSMGEITGALVGIALVLSAVFVPMAFFGGSTGVIYRQFSVTMVSAMALSVLVALVLTPALCATLLKPVEHAHTERRGFFGWFNRSFDASAHAYRRASGGVVRRWLGFALAYVLIVAGLGYLFVRLPSSFVPDEDQGILFSQVVLPVGATAERTEAVLKQVEDYFLTVEKDAVESVFDVRGFSFAGQGQNVGMAFIKLKDWDERKNPALRAQAIAGRAMGALSRIRDAMAFTFPPPAILELGNASGFDLFLQDRAANGHDALIAARNQLLGLAAQDPRLMAVRPNGQEDTPQYSISIDQPKAGALGVALSDISNLMSYAWGGTYVNDFVDRSRIKKVYVQADAPFRMLPEDVSKWFVRNGAGGMVPFSAFARGEWAFGPARLERYNGVSAVEIQGSAPPGGSTGAAMQAIEDIAAKLPPGFGVGWTGLSYQERLSGSQAPALYAISLLVVFLCLAALYESWTIPIAVMLVVPLGVAGSVLAATGWGLSNDIYFQVGLLTIIGLSAKNAILIVEFAKDRYEAGTDLVEATLDAARQRLRPIIMTSLAFVLGVAPLALSNSAGSGAQNAIGVGVIGGMIAATFLGIFFVPMFFVVVMRAFGRKSRQSAADAPAVSSFAPSSTAEGH